MTFLETLETASTSSIQSDLTPSPVEECRPRPLNIVHVITRLLLGGAEENTVATCLHQAACGHRVTLITGKDFDPSWAKRFGDRIQILSVESLVHPISPLTDLRAILDLHRLYQKLHPDIVHTHESKAGILGRAAATAARVSLVVHTIHIAPFVAVSGAKRRLYVEAERACARLSHLLIAVSRGMQQAYLEAGIGGVIPIPVIHSGMPLERFAAAVSPTEWRSRIGGWNRDRRPRFILKIAAFEERKRHLPLLHALAAGLRERPDTCVLFAGDGPDRMRCEEAARTLGIGDQVRFLGHDHAPWELVALADLCIHAAEREGLPRSAVQAIAGGKPLVVANLPGIEEIVADGINGIVTDADDLTILAAQMFALLDSPDRLALLQDGARSTDVSSWQEERMGERIDRAYASASVAGARRPPITTIEFLGLPGSGKTTIARQLLSLLREQRAPVRFSRDAMGDDLPFLRRSLRRLALVARAFLHGPRAMSLAARGLTPLRPGGKDALKTRWNFLSVLAMHLKAVRSGLVIADQGLAQAIWTARIHHGSGAVPTPPLFSQLGEWVTETLFIHVDASAAVSQERLARRRQHTSRFQNAESIGNASLWSRGEQDVGRLVEEIDDELKRRGLAGRLLSISSCGADTSIDLARYIGDHLCRLERDAASQP